MLTSHQYQVVLGMRAFGAAAGKLPAAREISAPASVMDIAPTLTQLAGVQTGESFDGLSLVPLMAADAPLPAEFTHRVRFTETEYTPVGVATPDGKMSASGIAKAAQMYEIDPVTDRVQVRREHLKPMLTIRQYAAIGDEYLLVAVPFRSEGLSHHYLLLPKTGGKPQLLTGAAFTRCSGGRAPRLGCDADESRRASYLRLRLSNESSPNPLSLKVGGE